MIEAVIFDLGGVLADFGGVGPMRELAGMDTDEEVWERWLACPWVRSFESGGCSVEEFAAGVVDEWGLPTSSDDFLEGFTGWLAGPFPGAEDLVRAVRETVPVGCLSNTNDVHWIRAISTWPLADMFDYRFLSFQIGLLKPDGEIFEHVVGQVGLEPESLLFLDDNLINVEAARQSGLRADRVRGIDEARASLVAHGIL